MSEKTGNSISLPIVEWIVVALGVVITLGLFGYIGWQAVTANGEKVPMITVEAGEAHAYPGGWVVEVTARNRSPQTASGVEIEGTLNSGGEETKASATLTYIPGNSSKEAGLFFPEDPSSGTLEVRATGYETP